MSHGPVMICLCRCNRHCKQGEKTNTINCIPAKRTFSNGDRISHAASESATVMMKQGEPPIMFKIGCIALSC